MAAKKFHYIWKNKEANFGPPLKKQVDGGTHITFEIILKKGGKYIALRRPDAIPGHEHPAKPKTNSKGFLYFCHNLIRYGESVEECVRRIVKQQTGAAVSRLKIVHIDSFVQAKDNQWAFMPYVIAELEKIPESGTYGNKVTEVVQFTKTSIPEDFGWWKNEEIKDFLEKYD